MAPNASVLVESGHRDGASQVDLERAKIVYGADALAEVDRNLAEADLEGPNDRLPSLGHRHNR